MSFVASCRLNGTTLYFIERCATDLADAEVAMDENGRIPAFPSEDEARAEIARRFPLPRAAQLTDSSSADELAGAMEDNYARFMDLSYDLDAAREWAKAPGPSGISPELAVDVWELCSHVGEAPPLQRFDPMGMGAIYENMMRYPERRDEYELLLLGMKLSGSVSVALRTGRPAIWQLDMPDLAEPLPKTDYARLATILETGIAGFARRLL
jgi:hypothetical protein